MLSQIPERANKKLYGSPRQGLSEVQGRPQLRLQKSCQFQVPKMTILVMVMTIFPFPFCWWKRSRVSKACNPGASRLGEAWPRPGRGHASDAKRIGTRIKRGLRGFERNHIIILLKSQQGWTCSRQLCYLARILGRSWRRGMASRQASRLQVDGNCSKTKSL